MAARTVDEVAAELARMLPSHLAGPADPLLGGLAAALQTAESLGYDAATATTIEGADGIWLDLILRGEGASRTDGETDDGARARLRNPQFGITPANIKAQVDAILAAYGLGECRILEWFEGPALGLDAYLGWVPVVPAANWFLIIVPSVAEDLAFSYLGDSYAGRDAWLGTWATDPAVGAYAAIAAAVHPIRAAGIRWALYSDTTGVYL